MEIILNRLSESLDKRREEGTLRVLRIPGNETDFSSNDYLGLARNKDLAEDIARHYSQQETANGSGGSRLITGNSMLAEQLENELADFLTWNQASCLLLDILLTWPFCPAFLKKEIPSSMMNLPMHA